MSERLSWSEAEAVVRAYRAEHGMATDVDVATLARTLGTSPAEVRRLAGRSRRFTDRSGVVSALVSVGVVAVVALAFGTSYLAHRAMPYQGAPIVAQAARHPRRVTVIDLQNGFSQTLVDSDLDPNPTNGSGPSEERATFFLPDEKTL